MMPHTPTESSLETINQETSNQATESVTEPNAEATASQSVNSATNQTTNCSNQQSTDIPMYNIVMMVAYNGNNYAGFQKQEHAVTVQGKLEQAISKIANHPVITNCAGRTDANVHGTNQVINFTTHANRPLHGWLRGVNSNLPSDIRVTQVFAVDGDFHARFSAQARRYRYLINIDKQGLTPAHLANLITTINFEVDIERMNQACQYLLGEQDFKSFQAVKCQSPTSNRNIHHAFWREWQGLLVFDIQANAFLYHMVRNIVGALLEVGKGKLTPQQFKEIIAQRDRTKAPAMAPADGLYLVAVDYSNNYPEITPSHLGPLFIPNQI